VKSRQTIRKPKAIQLFLGQGSETKTVLKYGKESYQAIKEFWPRSSIFKENRHQTRQWDAGRLSENQRLFSCF